MTDAYITGMIRIVQQVRDVLSMKWIIRKKYEVITMRLKEYVNQPKVEINGRVFADKDIIS